MKLIYTIIPILASATEHSLIWHPEDINFQYLPNKYSNIKNLTPPLKTSKPLIYNTYHTSRLIANSGDSLKISCPNIGFDPNNESNQSFTIYKVDKSGFDTCSPINSAYSDKIYSCDVQLKPLPSDLGLDNSITEIPDLHSLSLKSDNTASFYGQIDRKIFDTDPLDWTPGQHYYFISNYMSINELMSDPTGTTHHDGTSTGCIRFVVYVNEESEITINESKFYTYESEKLNNIKTELELFQKNSNRGKFTASSGNTNLSNTNTAYNFNFLNFLNKFDDNSQLLIAMGLGASLVIIILGLICCCYKFIYLNLCHNKRRNSSNLGYSSGNSNTLLYNDYNNSSSTNPLTLSNLFRNNRNRSTINYSDSSHINVSSVPNFYKSNGIPSKGITVNSYNHPILNNNVEYTYHPVSNQISNQNLNNLHHVNSNASENQPLAPQNSTEGNAVLNAYQMTMAQNQIMQNQIATLQRTLAMVPTNNSLQFPNPSNPLNPQDPNTNLTQFPPARPSNITTPIPNLASNQNSAFLPVSHKSSLNSDSGNNSGNSLEQSSSSPINSTNLKCQNIVESCQDTSADIEDPHDIGVRF